MNHKLFDNVLSQISNESIRNFTIKCLQEVDPILEKIPASVSGKYHPPDALGEGGLVRHILRACYFANIFASSYKWDNTQIMMDLLLSALLLHDIGKKEKYDNYWEYHKHPVVAVKIIEKNKSMIHQRIYDIISGCVLHHMGPFGDKSYRKEMKKYNFLELATYHCDYMASRKDLEIQRETK